MPDPVPCDTTPRFTSEGNIYAVVNKAERCLRHAHREAAADTMTAEVFAAGSYGEALAVIARYVTLDPEDYA